MWPIEVFPGVRYRGVVPFTVDSGAASRPIVLRRFTRHVVDYGVYVDPEIVSGVLNNLGNRYLCWKVTNNESNNTAILYKTFSEQLVFQIISENRILIPWLEEKSFMIELIILI